jgi:hypothetical protein
MNVAICVAIGVVTGIVAGLCGVGGGIIMVPAFATFLKLEQRNAVATSLAAVVLTAIAASIKNTSNDLVVWKVAVPTALAGAAVAWFTADWLKALSNVTLTRLFAVLLIAIGAKMLFTAA